MHLEYPIKKINPLVIEEVADLILKAASQQINIFSQERSQKGKRQKKQFNNKSQRPIAMLNVINKLHEPNNYTKKAEERRLQKLYKQVDNHKNFRVQNQTSKRINKKNPSKPIFERAQQILHKREKKLNIQKMYFDNQNDVFEKNKIVKKDVKVDKKKANEWNQKQQNYQKTRTNYLNNRRMEVFNKTFSNLKSKPQLTNETQHIIRQNRYANKSVLDRFQEHNTRKKHEDMMRIKRVTEAENPFSPNINKKSKLLAARSYSHIGQSVFQRMSRSPSRQCIKKCCHDIIRLNQTHHAYRQYKSRSKSKTNVMNVTFSSPIRSVMRSMSKNRLPKGSDFKSNASKATKALSRQKVNLNHIQSCEYFQQNLNDQHENKELRNILLQNKAEVIKFVKELIVKQKMLESL